MIALTVGEAQNGEISEGHVQNVLGARCVDVGFIATVHIEVGPRLQIGPREVLSRDEQDLTRGNVGVSDNEDGGSVVIVVRCNRGARRAIVLHGEVLHFALAIAVVFGRRKRR